MDEKRPFARQVVGQMLDAETERHIAEQKAALETRPDWAEGHFHLGQLYRVYRNRRGDAKRELLRALELKPSLADAHAALGEIYVAEGDLERATEHARYAAQLGNTRLLERLRHHGVGGEPGKP